MLPRNIHILLTVLASAAIGFLLASCGNGLQSAIGNSLSNTTSTVYRSTEYVLALSDDSSSYELKQIINGLTNYVVSGDYAFDSSGYMILSVSESSDEDMVGVGEHATAILVPDEFVVLRLFDLRLTPAYLMAEADCPSTSKAINWAMSRNQAANPGYGYGESADASEWLGAMSYITNASADMIRSWSITNTSGASVPVYVNSPVSIGTGNCASGEVSIPGKLDMHISKSGYASIDFNNGKLGFGMPNGATGDPSGFILNSTIGFVYSKSLDSSYAASTIVNSSGTTVRPAGASTSYSIYLDSADSPQQGFVTGRFALASNLGFKYPMPCVTSKLSSNKRILYCLSATGSKYTSILLITK